MGCARLNIEWSKSGASAKVEIPPKGKISAMLRRYIAYINWFIANSLASLKVTLGARGSIVISIICSVESIMLRVTRAAQANIIVGFVCDANLGTIYVLQETTELPILTIDGGYIFLRES